MFSSINTIAALTWKSKPKNTASARLSFPITTSKVLFVQFQESLFKGSGELELLIYTAEDNDN